MKKCPHCSVPLDLPPAPDCPPEWVNTLLRLPWCCNRCADWGQKRQRLSESIGRQCAKLVALSKKIEEDEKDPRTKGTVRKFLASLSKAFARNTCAYFRVAYSENPETGTWLPDFVDELVAHADRPMAVLRGYEQGIKKLALAHLGGKA